MHMEDMQAAVSAALYGPLQPGQEEPRWQLVNQVKTQLSAGAVQVESSPPIA
jgi:hypothetical protein